MRLIAERLEGHSHQIFERSDKVHRLPHKNQKSFKQKPPYHAEPAAPSLAQRTGIAFGPRPEISKAKLETIKHLAVTLLAPHFFMGELREEDFHHSSGHFGIYGGWPRR
jgi:hypothetical protein